MDNPLALLGIGIVLFAVGIVLPVYGLAWIAALGFVVWAGVEWRRGRGHRAERDAVRRKLLDAAGQTRRR